MERLVEYFMILVVVAVAALIGIGLATLSDTDVFTSPASSPLPTVVYRYILRVNGYEYKCQNFEFGGDNKSDVWLHDCQGYSETIRLENYTEFTVLRGPGSK